MNPAYDENDGLIRFIKAREAEKAKEEEVKKMDKLTKNEFKIDGYPHVFGYWDGMDFRYMANKYLDLDAASWKQVNKKRKTEVFEGLAKLEWTDLQSKVIEENRRKHLEG